MAKTSKTKNLGANAHVRNLRKGLEALAAGNPEEAESLAVKVLSGRPEHPDALHLLGLALLAQGRASAALVPLEATVRLAPNPASQTDLASALQRTGLNEEAGIMLEHVTQKEPPYLPAFHDLGVLHFAQGRLDEAKAVLERGLAIEPASPELNSTLGTVLLEQGDVAEAKVVLARAMTNAPGHPAAAFGMGNALMAEGDFARAAERFRTALEVDPGHGGAMLNLGTCLLELDRSDEAVASLRVAVQSIPELREQALTLLTKLTTDRDRAEELLAAP